MKIKLGKIIVVLASLTLAACGDTSSVDTINFMVYSPATQESINALKQLIASYSTSSGVKVNLITVEKENYDETFRSAVRNGKFKPDLAYIDQPLIATYAQDNIIVPVLDYIAEWDDIELSDFNQEVLSTNEYQGALYGLPLNMTASVLFYNRDLVNDANVPTTWEQWKNFSVPSQKALFEGIGVGGFAGWYFQAFAKNAGGDIYNSETNQATFNTFQCREAAQFLKDIYRNDTDYLIHSSSNPFLNGDCLFKIGSSFDIGNILKQKPQFNLGVALMPSQSGEEHYSVMGGENLVITNVSKNKDKAADLLHFLLQEENNSLLSSFTGNFPAITEYAQTEDARLQVVLDQLEYVVARPVVPNWIKINDNYLGKAIEDILDYETNRDITDALSWAEQAANTLLG